MKQKTVAILAVIAALLLSFHLGVTMGGSRLHRRECVLTGGYPKGLLSRECYFDQEYDAAIRERLDRSCSDGRGWYVYNDTNRYWVHKCN